jgi:hypothetical protein
MYLEINISVNSSQRKENFEHFFLFYTGHKRFIPFEMHYILLPVQRTHHENFHN